MKARRIITAQGVAYAYRDRDQFLRRLWVISENSPDELYQELERIRRLLGVDICKSRFPINRAAPGSARHAYGEGEGEGRY